MLSNNHNLQTMYKAYTERVYVSDSLLVSSEEGFKIGKGLFAKEDIQRGNVICTYSGQLYYYTIAKSVDPTYMVSFEFGKGDKLAGDNDEGDLGHFANSIHPNDPTMKQNASLDLNSRKFRKVTYISNDIKRGRFILTATKNIAKGEEIILDYGKGYWKTLRDYHEYGVQPLSEMVLERNKRTEDRSIRKNEIKRHLKTLTQYNKISLCRGAQSGSSKKHIAKSVRRDNYDK